MNLRKTSGRIAAAPNFFLKAFIALCCSVFVADAQPSASVRKFSLRSSQLELTRRTQSGSFFDVVGRKAALFGYENRAFEAWVYPMKLIDDFTLSFRLASYPTDVAASDILTSISVRPEATIFTYSHAAFTVRQILFAPIDEPGVIMLLDIDSVLPMTITGSFRPKLKLMWPATMMTGSVGWDEREHAYSITEETQRFAGFIGSPAARDISIQPYQEEPKDLPVKFVIERSVEDMKSGFLPIVIAGSVEGRAKAKDNYERLLAEIPALYEKNVAYWERFNRDTVSVTTPDERANQAFAWAKVGVEKGFAANPFLGTGLLAGYRTSGESERPGFAWFFGRDALWTALSITAYGDFAGTKTALDFLKKHQRADGKIPHEISQSATLVPWFTEYPYAWASADATPLYVIAVADYWRASGDARFVESHWEALKKAYQFTLATDADGNGLIENTNVGHGWVEGGALYPAHEEIYMQGLWVEASRSMAALANAMQDTGLSAKAQSWAARARSVMEKTYWMEDRKYYAFATMRPRETPTTAEPGPYREARQRRLDEMSRQTLVDEDTVLPAVPLWWETLNDEHAQFEIDHLGSGAIATDWGARILSNRSRLYDPLSYHYGSVWPLFTGWTAMAGYRYGRPHVGFQALMANVGLTYSGALGNITELLSGDFNTPFGRSSHHQIWSEAMTVTPMLRGMFGIEATDGGKSLTFAPQPPANWNAATISNVRVAESRYTLLVEKSPTKTMLSFIRQKDASDAASAHPMRLVAVATLPLDARVSGVNVNGKSVKPTVMKQGDIQRVEVVIQDASAEKVKVTVSHTEGSSVHISSFTSTPGSKNQGLRVIRARTEKDVLRLSLEAPGGSEQTLFVHTSKPVGKADGVRIVKRTGDETELAIKFDGSPDTYVLRDVVIPVSGKN